MREAFGFSGPRRPYRHIGRECGAVLGRSDYRDLEASRSEPVCHWEALIVPDSGECKRLRSFDLTG